MAGKIPSKIVFAIALLFLLIATGFATAQNLTKALAKNLNEIKDSIFTGRAIDEAQEPTSESVEAAEGIEETEETSEAEIPQASGDGSALAPEEQPAESAKEEISIPETAEETTPESQEKSEETGENPEAAEKETDSAKIEENKTELIEENNKSEIEKEEEKESEKKTEGDIKNGEQEKSHPILDIQILHPEKITRGKIIELKAIASNNGNSKAKDVLIKWELPPEFSVASINGKSCGDLNIGESCTSEIKIQVSFSASLGKNQVKAIAEYKNE